jgi:hypothetical protein
LHFDDLFSYRLLRRSYFECTVKGITGQSNTNCLTILQ